MSREEPSTEPHQFFLNQGKNKTFLIKYNLHVHYFIVDINVESFYGEEMTSTELRKPGLKFECNADYSLQLSFTLSVFIAVVCVVGNSTVLFIYTRSKEIAESKIFELAFAVLDIFSCLFLLPVVILPDFYCIEFSNPPLIINIINNMVGPIAFNGYYSLLVCVAIDRFCAVFYPLQFKIMRKKYISKMIIGV